MPKRKSIGDVGKPTAVPSVDFIRARERDERGKATVLKINGSEQSADANPDKNRIRMTELKRIVSRSRGQQCAGFPAAPQGPWRRDGFHRSSVRPRLGDFAPSRLRASSVSVRPFGES